MTTLRLTLLALVGSLAALPACFEAPAPACAFACGEGDACPTGYACGSTGYCQRVMEGGVLAPCGFVPVDAPVPLPDAPADAVLADATPVDAALADATPVDATPVDAGPPDALVCVDLAPASDGSGRQALVLAEVNPTEFVELFNPTNADIDLASTQYALKSGTSSLFLSTLALVVPARSYRELTWPVGWDATDAGGEVILYQDTSTLAHFDEGAKQTDFLCWGTGAAAGTRKPLAELSGKWTAAAACADALAQSSIRRRAATAGTSAADYLTDRTPFADACTAP